MAYGTMDIRHTKKNNYNLEQKKHSHNLKIYIYPSNMARISISHLCRGWL